MLPRRRCLYSFGFYTLLFFLSRTFSKTDPGSLYIDEVDRQCKRKYGICKSAYNSGEIMKLQLAAGYCGDIYLNDPFGIPELIAVACVAGLQVWKHNSLISILTGTVIYMVLVQMVF